MSTLFVRVQTACHVVRIAVSKNLGDIRCDEEGFSVFCCGDADVVAEVVEDGDVVLLLVASGPAPSAGPVVDPVFDGVDCPCGASATSHDVVDVWLGEEALG